MGVSHWLFLGLPDRSSTSPLDTTPALTLFSPCLLLLPPQAFIKEEVSSFSPAADDLDYPGKLQRAAQEAESAAAEAQRDGQDGSDGGDSGEAGAAPEGSDAANKVHVAVGWWGVGACLLV